MRHPTLVEPHTDPDGHLAALRLRVTSHLAAAVGSASAATITRDIDGALAAIQDGKAFGEVLRQLQRGLVATFDGPPPQRDAFLVDVTALLAVAAFQAGPALATRLLELATGAGPANPDNASRHQAIAQAERNSEERIQALFRNSSDVVSIISPDGVIEYVSDSVERILGYDPQALVGSNVLDLIPVDAQGQLAAQFVTVLDTPLATAQAASPVRHADGSDRWMEFDFSNLASVPSVSGIVVTARDVTRRRLAEQQLAILAYSDPLTGLPNRTHVREWLDQVMARSAECGDDVAVIILDLDRFKMINDRYGHDGGDTALTAASQRIVSTLSPGETAGRLGGDEFAIVIEQATARQAMATAQRLIDALAEPLPDLHHSSSIGASAGVAIGSGQLHRPADLLRAADIALYQGKAIGGGVAILFEPGMDEPVMTRTELERSLHLALDRHEIRAWFMPEVDLASGEWRSLEILMRWERDDGTVQTPDTFIGIATELGVIAPLGLAVLRDGCEQMVRWQRDKQVGDGLTMTFNVSQREVALPDYPARIADVAREAGFPLDRLEIEIDDRLYREPTPEMDRFLAAIQRLGLGVIVDGFGGDHASWRRLQGRPPGRVKIDRLAAGAPGDNEIDLAILRAATAMGKSLGIPVTAVGLETEALAARARVVGCQRGQGFHFGAPMPAGAIPPLLRSGPTPGA